jgi:hypothetical protein
VKLSIWQQFSSNHSARFELVGVFNRPELAAKAGEELTEMLRPIFEWYQKNGDNLPQEKEWLPSPVEQELADRLGIKWNDITMGPWLWFNEDGTGSVRVVDTLVIIHGWESDGGAKPLDDIIHRLGGHAFVSGTREMVNLTPGDPYPVTLVIGSEVSFTIMCPMADEAAAESLARKLSAGSVNQDETQNVVLQLGKTEVKFGSVGRSGASVRLANISVHPLYSGIPALFDHLTELGVTQFECVFTESNSESTYIRRAK